MEREFNLHDGESGSAITVRVVPRSSRNEISDILADGTLKIRLVDPAVEDKLNPALITFLAEVLSVEKSAIEIVAGIKGNNKLITILNLDRHTVHERVLKHISNSTKD